MTNSEKKKMILRYAAIIAKDEAATSEEQAQLKLIEDQLHLTKESILRQATEFALSAIR